MVKYKGAIDSLKHNATDGTVAVGIYSDEGCHNITVDPELGHKLRIGQIITFEIDYGDGK